MAKSSFDPGDPVAYAELKKDLEFKEKEVKRLEKDLSETGKRLQEKDARLDQLLAEMNKAVSNLALRDQEVAQKDKTLRERAREASRGKKSARIRNLCALVLSVFSTLAINFGVNMATSAPPDMMGYVMIGFGIVGAIVAGCISLVITS